MTDLVTKVLAAAAVLVLAIGLPTDSALAARPDVRSVSVNGILHRTVEAGGWVVQARDGRQYLLVGLNRRHNPGWFREGARVAVIGRLAPDTMSIYMQGTPLQVDHIRMLAGRRWRGM
jgi:hypothetical protein